MVLVALYHATFANAQTPVTLKEAYRDAFMIGTAVSPSSFSQRRGSSRDIVLSQFNSITAENDMKAGPIHPHPDVYEFTAADAIVDFGKANNMFVVGHTLVWHNQTPDWFFINDQGVTNTPEQQIERMRQHIETVAGRYAGRVDAWDVVNEVIDNDGSYRPTTWVQSVGDGDKLVRAAFKFAGQYAPDAELYYNDFNAWRPEKVSGIVRMAKMLKEHGIRIDGIGMQGHWGLNFPKNQYIQAAIDAYAEVGLQVMITELDVDVLPLTREGQVIVRSLQEPQFQLEEFEEYLDPYQDGLPPEVQQQLTDRYAELFEIFYANRDKISRVTLWGIHDGNSWKNNYPVPARTNYPLLFDRNLRPKSALQAVLEIPQGKASLLGDEP
ncbi:MAG: endo-1,4-beta-xylanase [Planctomycetales bacterium]|nr:endo-1,4-beta-xylanase [Planctomycetales bacterium]